jgi:hypothetical protein
MDLNLIRDFYIVNIFTREASGDIIAHERSHEAQTGMGGAAYRVGHATMARLALGRRLASVFLYTSSLRQKRDALFFP